LGQYADNDDTLRSTSCVLSRMLLLASKHYGDVWFEYLGDETFQLGMNLSCRDYRVLRSDRVARDVLECPADFVGLVRWYPFAQGSEIHIKSVGTGIDVQESGTLVAELELPCRIAGRVSVPLLLRPMDKPLVDLPGRGGRRRELLLDGLRRWGTFGPVC